MWASLSLFPSSSLAISCEPPTPVSISDVGCLAARTSHNSWKWLCVLEPPACYWCLNGFGRWQTKQKHQAQCPRWPQPTCSNRFYSWSGVKYFNIWLYVYDLNLDRQSSDPDLFSEFICSPSIKKLVLISSIWGLFSSISIYYSLTSSNIIKNKISFNPTKKTRTNFHHQWLEYHFC